MRVNGRLGQRVLAWALAACDRPPAGAQTLDSEITVATPLDQTFAFFAEAGNLERLTPPWLNFTILTPSPLVMREGLEIDYRIRVHGLSIPWRTRIDAWHPGVRFVDRQTMGPYRWWRHEHLFEEVAGGTRVIDRVEYAPRANWGSRWIVRRDLERIFAYRREALGRIFSR
jgi:ligand-binding SRPBCC domain-containing protein